MRKNSAGDSVAGSRRMIAEIAKSSAPATSVLFSIISLRRGVAGAGDQCEEQNEEREPAEDRRPGGGRPAAREPDREDNERPDGRRPPVIRRARRAP